MKKTSLSRWTVILFTAAIAAVNIPVIAQPQNNRLDSLKREYSYEVCKQYLIFNNQNHHTHEHTVSFPIVRIFPQYFEPSNSEIRWPDYTYLRGDYGCPVHIRVKAGNKISERLTESRKSLDSVTNMITNILYSDSIYRRIVAGKNTSENNRLLKNEEMRIRKNHMEITHLTSENNYPKGSDYYNQVGKRYKMEKLPYGGYKYEYDNGVPAINNIRFTGPNRRKRYISYLNHYYYFLSQANLASLRVILDDHIRLGVPIDISWIPEQTLADIEATKPVRQLKKQIKALEKRQKQ